MPCFLTIINKVTNLVQLVSVCQGVCAQDRLGDVGYQETPTEVSPQSQVQCHRARSVRRYRHPIGCGKHIDFRIRPGMSLRGNTQMSAPVSMRNRIPEALSRTNRRRDVVGQVSPAAINNCPAGFPASTYKVRYISWLSPGMSSGTSILHLAAAPWTANAGAAVAEAIPHSHWRPLAPG